MAHRHHAIRRLKARALDARHVPVHIVAAPVVLQRVDMRHKRLSRQLADKDARRIGHPVVDVDDVETRLPGNGHRRASVAIDLAHEIRAVAAVQTQDRFLRRRKNVRVPFHRLEAFQLTPPLVIAFRRVVREQQRVHVLDVQLFAPQFPHFLIDPEVPGRTLHPRAGCRTQRQAFPHPHRGVQGGLRQDEQDFRAFLRQRPAHTVARRPKAAALVGRKFPAEHQNAHQFPPFRALASHSA